MAGSSAESALGSHSCTFQSGLELRHETALRYQPMACVITSTGPEGFTLLCLIKFSITSQTSLWKVSYCKSRQRNTQRRDGYSVLFITEKILGTSEPPRTLISFVSIDFWNKGGPPAPLALVQARYELLIKSLTTLCTQPLWKLTRRRRSSYIIQKVLVSLKLLR